MDESKTSNVLSREQMMQNIKEAEWPVRYGSAIMVICGGITGNIFNYHYRRLCGMGKAFRMTTFIPAAMICPLFSGLLHAGEVNSLIAKKEMELECPVCYEVKCGTVQFISGGLYPLLSAYLCCTGLTRKHMFDNLKKIGMSETTSKLSQFKMTLPPKQIAPLLLLCNFAVGVIVAQLELRSTIDQMKKERN